MQQTMSAQDRLMAQRIPEDFVAGSGDSVSRISRIVTQAWWQYGADSLCRLVEPLLAILGPLQDGDVQISQEHRDECQAIVAEWLEDQ